ncbi:MAG: hypothetical protein JST31_05380 [Actinobacteria bacterium]|nr:hypothetical protein [Actinomycetota bacterium]
MKRSLVMACLLLIAAAATASPAKAAFGVSEAQLFFHESDGSDTTQAGSHPYEMVNELFFNTVEDPGVGFKVPDGNSKGLRISFPAGFAGNPTAAPYCSSADFLAEVCPPSSQIGTGQVFSGGEGAPAQVYVYNLQPAPGMVAKIGFKALTVPIAVALHVNPEPPFNLVASLENIPEVTYFYGSILHIWGTPAAPSHDAERGCGSGCSLHLPEKPFLLMPRSCTAALQSLFEVSSWEQPDSWLRSPASAAGTTGCGSLAFGPRVAAEPSSHASSSATGLTVEVGVADEGINSPNGIAQSDIQKAEITFPEGVSANPAVANGLVACSPEQFRAQRLGGVSCPGASKIGTVEATTPLLEGKLLKGSLFVAEPFRNRFGTLIGLYATLEEPEMGILLKLEGKAEPDPRTGQLKGTFDELPQYPVSHFTLRFREGARAPLVTPARCGSYETQALLTPWANPATPYRATAHFTISSGPGGGPCSSSPPFEPQFEAGTASNQGSSYSPFYMRIARNDGEQELTRINAVLPPGLSGNISGIAKCSDAALAKAAASSGAAELAEPSCPESSQIGRVLIGVGAGGDLTYVPGKVYLAGPFGGDPLSVAVITPGIAGPFDIGTVVTREALTVNPETAEVQIDGSHSEPIPRILKGIPLQVREVRVYLDRSKFTFNSTSCEPNQVQATLLGSGADPLSPSDDSVVGRGARYQAAGCASLGFKPKLSLEFKGGTKRTQYPGLRSVLTYPYPSGPGYANIARASVLLPKTTFIDQGHVNSPCTRVQFNQNACPKKSILGTARAVTPILDEPLEGPVYFRSNGGERLLPDIVADLKGQFEIVLVGQVHSVVHGETGRIKTTFATVPDAPVTKFTLNLKGGKEGLLVNSASLCRTDQQANINFAGQNGKSYSFSTKIRNSCKKQSSHGGRPKR